VIYRPTYVPRGWIWRGWLPYALLTFGGVLSVAVAFLVAADARDRARAELETDAVEIRLRIEERVDTYMDLLHAGAALLRADQEINRAEFRAFLSGLDLHERYPGAHGIGFVQRVRSRDAAAFLRLLRLDGITNLRKWPVGQRAEYYPLVFLEPSQPANDAQIGFDLATDALMRTAMDRARDTAQPAATRETSLQRPDHQGHVGFAVFFPVFQRNVPIDTVAQRRQALVGFVYGPFKAGALQQDVITDQREVTFSVSDSPRGEESSPESTGFFLAERPRLTSTQRVAVAGVEWYVEVTSMHPAPGPLPPAAAASLAAGLLISLMVFLVTRAQVCAGSAQARHAAELQASTDALHRTDAELRRLVILERDARALAQKADRAKDEFLATLSHELRTPLNAILGWTSMLRQGAVTAERRANALEIIGRNARLQAQLVEDLLDVSRIDAGNLRVGHQLFPIAPIAHSAIESLRPVAQAKGVTVVADVTAEDLLVAGDGTRMLQVLTNLLSNAVKFTPAGGHVHLAIAGDRQNIDIRVRDTGIGIAPEFLPHVFERFRQEDSSTTRAHSGVGLGLSIARHLVERHGGTIEAHSEGPGRGALFIVRLPRHFSSTQQPVPREVRESRMAASSRLQPAHSMPSRTSSHFTSVKSTTNVA
jgi:signal transduction histidine kinase/sensor domain CHASE-containing protein